MKIVNNGLVMLEYTKTCYIKVESHTNVTYAMVVALWNAKSRACRTRGAMRSTLDVA